MRGGEEGGLHFGTGLVQVQPERGRCAGCSKRVLTFSLLHQEGAWGHRAGGRSTPASRDAIKSCPGAGRALQRDWPLEGKELFSFQTGFQQPAAPPGRCDGCVLVRVQTPSAHAVHPSSSSSRLGDIAVGRDGTSKGCWRIQCYRGREHRRGVGVREGASFRVRGLEVVPQRQGERIGGCPRCSEASASHLFLGCLR